MLVDLLSAGIEGAVEPALDWVKAAHPRAGSPYTLVQALDHAFSDPRFAGKLDEENLFEVLIGALDSRSLKNVVVPILRRRTGRDFGFYDAFQIQDSAERVEAQEECYENWRRWWQDRVDSHATEK